MRHTWQRPHAASPMCLLTGFVPVCRGSALSVGITGLLSCCGLSAQQAEWIFVPNLSTMSSCRQCLSRRGKAATVGMPSLLVLPLGLSTA